MSSNRYMSWLSCLYSTHESGEIFRPVGLYPNHTPSTSVAKSIPITIPSITSQHPRKHTPQPKLPHQPTKHQNTLTSHHATPPQPPPPHPTRPSSPSSTAPSPRSSQRVSSAAWPWADTPCRRARPWARRCTSCPRGRSRARRGCACRSPTRFVFL